MRLATPRYVKFHPPMSERQLAAKERKTRKHEDDFSKEGRSKVGGAVETRHDGDSTHSRDRREKRLFLLKQEPLVRSGARFT